MATGLKIMLDDTHAVLHEIPVSADELALAAVAVSIGSSTTTYEEFLLSSESASAEWVNGEVIDLNPPSTRHQLISGFLSTVLRVYVEAKALGEIISAPFQMKTAPDLPGREPDVLFIATAQLGRLQDNYLQGPADVAVEVVSPESLVRDRGEKFMEYERGGVREYWIIDPLRQHAEFYHLEDGIFHPLAIDEIGVFRSVVIPGVWLRVAWLWQEPLPPVMTIFREWGLLS